MIRKIAGAVLMLLFVVIYVFAMVLANYAFGYDTALFVFIGSVCAFGFLFAIEIMTNDD